MSIKSNYRTIKRNAKKLIKSPFFRARFWFTHYYENNSVNDSIALFESYNNSNFSGNVFYILKEINTRKELNNIKKYISCKTKEDQKLITKFLNKNQIHNFEVIRVHTKKYCQILSSAKYLFNNATFPTYFIKKDGQIYFNTWHGTPLKTLGRSIASSPHEIGNTQRNFIMADYLLYPNEFTFNHMKKDYMLDNMYKGNYILGGYPRNHVFYNEQRINEIKNELELNNKEIICYMPTWRGSLDKKNVREQMVSIEYFLYQLDKVLSEEKVMFVKLHNYVSSQIDFSQFKYIKSFPEEYETYEFLSISDCLITDYSSVFFDYANLRKKIILFAYDKEEYLKDRGMYLQMEELPFPIVETVKQLQDEILDLNSYLDYSEFIKEYCSYDHEDYAKKITNLIFFDEKENMKIIKGDKFDNGKKKVLLYAGSLAKNGLTTSLQGLLNHVDTNKYNFIVFFYKNSVKKYTNVIKEFPDEISYYVIQGQKNISFKEAFVQFFYYRLNLYSKGIEKSLKRMYKRELYRLFNDKLHFDCAIHFTGYEKHIANLFCELKDCRRIMYVHNDMSKEKKTRSNYHSLSVLKAYRKFEGISCVREGLEQVIMSLVPEINADKIKVVHNVNDVERIIENSKKSLCFDKDTVSSYTVEQIEDILNNKNYKKYIDVARFSPEKGIKRLVESFERFNKIHQDTYLFIIGGHGSEYNEINEYVTTHQLNHVILIKSLSNIFPILVKCDVFIMSSYYEGLPMSIMEALILNKPVVCTDIQGPREFLSQGYGYLVDDSSEGVYKGFMDSYEKNLNLKHFDSNDFNRQALQEFYDTIE